MKESKSYREHADKARALWAAFSTNEQHGVRFGMFPAVKMREATAEGFELRRLTVALMDIAEENGGMRA